MLKLTVEDLYSKEESAEQPVLFEMLEVKQTTYRGDKLKLWRLKDEVKTLTYLQGSATPELWVEYQKRIEELEFKITSIFTWKKSKKNKPFAKSARDLD